jgi:hypothetical protein
MTLLIEDEATMLPTHQEIEATAYRRWRLRGGGDGFDQTDWFGAEQDLTIIQNYDRYRVYSLSAPERTYFGSRENRKCRYCRKAAESVTFKAEAHAIPHLTGNRSLFSFDECDECNKAFGETLDDSFGKFLLPMRTIHGISGKSGIPAFKTRDKSARIDVKDGRRDLLVTDRGASPLFVDDPGKRTLTGALQTQPYIPILVYKCLVKMALAIMPEEELPNFSHTLAWLSERDPARGLHGVRAAACYHYDVFVERPSSVFLLRRRTFDTPLPYMLFFLTMGRIVLQTYLPLTPMDNYFAGAGVPVSFPRMGAIVVPGKGESHFGAIRLGSAEAVRDNQVDVVLRYESCQETMKS